MFSRINPAGKAQEELDSAIRQIISKAIVSDKVIDIFDSVGLKKPDISILSDEFLDDVKKMPHKNLAFYDALEVNDSAVKVLGDEKLTFIARELVDMIHKNVTIDWTLKESVPLTNRRRQQTLF